MFQPLIPYYVILKATNGAGTWVITTSKVLILDEMEPVMGTVIDGTDIRKDVSFQNNLDSMSGD